MSKLALRTLPWALLAIGCSPGDEPGSEDGGGTSPATSDTSDGDPQTTADSMSGGIDGSGGGDTGDVSDAVPARGLTIRSVEANSGVAIAIGLDGEWVDGSQRNAPIPKNRDTAFRIALDVDEAVWTPREIEARLNLHTPDGGLETLTAVETITGDSPDQSIESAFLIVVPAAMMVPDLRFDVALFEAAPTGWESLPEPQVAPVLPPDGPNLVGVEAGDLRMRIVLVPIQYESATCTETFDSSAETLQEYEDAMFQQNPVESVQMEVHAPYVVNDLDLSDANDFFMLLQRIQQLRAQEQPDPDVYYYGIFDNCDQCVGFPGLQGCVLGVAAGLPDDSMGSATERVAIGAMALDPSELGGAGDVLQIGASTFVHEIGHTQGRQHVECPGVMAGGPDPTFPYPEGKIGVWGYGVLDSEIRSASDHSDYMSYCAPTWVSDWQWTATFNRIQTLSAWSNADIQTFKQHGVLVGAVNSQTGESHWWTDRGYLTEPTTGYRMRLLGDSGQLEDTPVQVSQWSEGPWMTVRAPMTANFDRADSIELVSPTRAYRTSRDAVSVYTRPDGLTTTP